MRVVIADPSWLVCAGIAHLLSQVDPACTVELSSDLDGLQKALRSTGERTIVLVGWDLVANQVGAVFGRIRAISPSATLGVLGDAFSQDCVLDVLSEGAMAAISISESKETVRVALERVLCGKVALPRDYLARQSPIPRLGSDLLTSREKDVFALLGEGLSVALVAEKLRISPHTARVHIARIMKKLDLRDRSALMHCAVSRLMQPLRDSAQVVGAHEGRPT